MLQAHQLMGLGCRVLSAQGECISPDFVSKFLAGSRTADHDEHLVTQLRLLQCLDGVTDIFEQIGAADRD